MRDNTCWPGYHSDETWLDANADMCLGRTRLVHIRAHTATLAAKEMPCVVHSVLLMLGREPRLLLDRNGMPSSNASAFKIVIVRFSDSSPWQGHRCSHALLLYSRLLHGAPNSSSPFMLVSGIVCRLVYLMKQLRAYHVVLGSIEYFKMGPELPKASLQYSTQSSTPSTAVPMTCIHN